MVIFEVEGYLYRVSMNLLEKESDYFRRLLVRHSQAGMYGKTDGMPIPLVDLERSAFDCILRFLHFSERAISVYEPDTISLDEWISLLSVSTLLQFARIRRWAIREITAQFSSLDAATVIVLATKHDVPQWLAPAYSELCRRREPLDDSEAEELGAVTTARVGRAREAIRDEFLKTAMCEACASGTPWDSVDHEPPEQLVTRIVDRVFWPEQS
ncbi:hypothetical protein EUX98_g1343 [Antrodiella citrinella]|uniref:BTB domain-containing protein n=1 Tax=Antrodiella citrinella TaxID=2447956 RepID=A0A4V3XJF4_9APHY|nr:hypothetical protein EUX98_g1343 [Antrodiella citrinella]